MNKCCCFFIFLLVGIEEADLVGLSSRRSFFSLAVSVKGEDSISKKQTLQVEDPDNVASPEDSTPPVIKQATASAATKRKLMKREVVSGTEVDKANSNTSTERDMMSLALENKGTTAPLDSSPPTGKDTLSTTTERSMMKGEAKRPDSMQIGSEGEMMLKEGMEEENVHLSPDKRRAYANASGGLVDEQKDVAISDTSQQLQIKGIGRMVAKLFLILLIVVLAAAMAVAALQYFGVVVGRSESRDIRDRQQRISERVRSFGSRRQSTRGSMSSVITTDSRLEQAMAMSHCSSLHFKADDDVQSFDASDGDGSDSDHSNYDNDVKSSNRDSVCSKSSVDVSTVWSGKWKSPKKTLFTGELWKLIPDEAAQMKSLKDWRPRYFAISLDMESREYSLNYLSGESEFVQLAVLRLSRTKKSAKIGVMATVDIDALPDADMIQQRHCRHQYQLQVRLSSGVHGNPDEVDVPTQLWPFSLSWEDPVEGEKQATLAAESEQEQVDWMKALKHPQWLKEEDCPDKAIYGH